MNNDPLFQAIEPRKHRRALAAVLLTAVLLSMCLTACGKAPEKENTSGSEALIDMTVFFDMAASGIQQVEDTAAWFTDPDLLSIPAGEVLEGVTPDGFHQPFFKSFKIPDDVFETMKGKSFKEDGQMERSDLRYLKMAYLDYDGVTRMGEMVVNKKCAKDVLAVFRELYEAEYQIHKMCLVDRYYDIKESDDRDTESDEQSIIDNNTSAFNYRSASNNHNILSNHSFGYAIDLNPVENPYVNADGSLDGPPSSLPFMDRSIASEENHMLADGDTCVSIFKAHGFSWGGNWSGDQDYQHFDWNG